MIIRTDDPIADFHRYDAEQQRQLELLPICDCCNEHIQDDYYEIGGEKFCEDCMNAEHKKSLDNYFDSLED